MIGQPTATGDGADPAGHLPIHAVQRLRTDAWNRIRDAARRLSRSGTVDADVPALRRLCEESLRFLGDLEGYFAFPGARAFAELRRHFDRGTYEAFARQTMRVVRLLDGGGYRRLDLSDTAIHDFADLLNVSNLDALLQQRSRRERRPYFELLVVDDAPQQEEAELHLSLLSQRRADDPFMYDAVVVHSLEDALVAAMANPEIQSCVLRYTFPCRAAAPSRLLSEIYALLGVTPEELESMMPSSRSILLGRLLRTLRPELDVFLVTDAPLEEASAGTGDVIRRVLYPEEGAYDLHLAVLRGVMDRHESPFFSALRRYSQKPTGVFHALPISRGNSIARSKWIGDMADFYGLEIFRAETSATAGGLDSLLQPTGPLKRAQELAARAFGSRRTYFVTNGTSTANKIVLQALIQPDDIVLVSHDCHKSHHYAVILAGGRPVYLDAYPLTRYSMYGAVPLHEVKRQLLALRRAGRLDRVRMLLLTNITFDGVTYDPERVMRELLAIKPDLIFVWDEAWFAYGRFVPLFRRRTAMAAAERLRARLHSPAYREEYAAWRAGFDPDHADDEAWLREPLLPDPELARVRVYATHSTHKTLTALRQGSMIHVHDQDFEESVRSVFDEAYMTHTSTSPNYQILASLDIGRRQVELEGYELVQRAVELAMCLRERVHSSPLLQRYFRVLGPIDMVPAEMRPSGLDYFFDTKAGWRRVDESWERDEFVLDPTRVTIDISRTGMDGDTFKKLLIERYDIQINKTSRNTVLFMMHIGTTRGMVAHLVKVLSSIANSLDESLERQSRVERQIHERRVAALTDDLPPLPNFSRFHAAFLDPDAGTADGDIRRAFFLAYDDGACRYLKLDGSLARAVEGGREVVSACFVTPYPPGFPVLVPGQVVTAGIVRYLRALDVKEIHGYVPDYGLRVFRPAALGVKPRRRERKRRPELVRAEGGRS